MKTKKGLLILVCACLLYGGHSYGWWETMKKYLGISAYQQRQKVLEELDKDISEYEKEDKDFDLERDKSKEQDEKRKKENEKFNKQLAVFKEAEKKIDESYKLVMKDYSKKTVAPLKKIIPENKKYVLEQLKELEVDANWSDDIKRVKNLLDEIDLESEKIIKSTETKKDKKNTIDEQRRALKSAQESFDQIEKWADSKKAIGRRALALKVKSAKEQLKKVTDKSLLDDKEFILRELDLTKRQVKVAAPIKTKIK